MDMDVTTQMVGLMAARTQQIAQIKMLKANHEMEMQLIEQLGAVAKSAPQPGTGNRVDKTA